MKNESLYNKTVSILVDSYFNDTLKHGSCAHCAVGNIISHHRPFSEKEKLLLGANSHEREGWTSVFCTFNAHTIMEHQYIEMGRYEGVAKDQIDASGYSVFDLAKIEFSFETAYKGRSYDEYMFNGLMAVIDVLDEIHENNDTQVTETSKRKFQKQI